MGKEVYKKFNIDLTPTTMVIGSDGSEIDWHSGYTPPPDSMLAKLENSVKNIDTFKSLSDRYTKNPKDVEAVFKLAIKYYDHFQQGKALEKFKEGVALDPNGKSGTYITEFEKARVTYTEYGEYRIALSSSRTGKKRDPQPFKSFIKKYPESELLKKAYQQLSFAMSGASKEEATKFFEEYTKKFSNDPAVLSSWLAHIVRTKENLDKGVELAEKIHMLTRYKSLSSNNRTMADLYLLKDDKLMVGEVYGKNFIKNRARIFALDLSRYANYWAGKKKNLESAQDMVELALQIQPDDSGILSQAAGLYIKMNKEDKALKLFGPEYFKKNITDSNNLWSYANFWARQGKNLDSALEAAKKIVDLAPEDYFKWDTLSSVYVKQKNFAEAIKASEKALELADGSMKEYMKKRLDQVKAAADREKK